MLHLHGQGFTTIMQHATSLRVVLICLFPSYHALFSLNVSELVDFFWYIHGKFTCLPQWDSVPVWIEMHLLELQSSWKTSKWVRTDSLVKLCASLLHEQLCLPSILTVWPHRRPPCQAVYYVGMQLGVGGENMFIRHHPGLLVLTVFYWVPTVNKALIGGTGTLPAGTRWGSFTHLQFWDEKAHCVLLRLLSLFAHIISALTNTAQWSALVTRLRGSNIV